MSENLLASEIYAESQGTTCTGTDRCHWCGAACDQRWTHDEPPPIIGFRPKYKAKCPANSYICVGCYLWRRKRITATFLNGETKDGRCPINHSWLISPKLATKHKTDSARAIAVLDFPLVYDFLLKPSGRFILALTTGEPNWIHLAWANNLNSVEIGTHLGFTLNNIPMTYSPYELEQALRYGPNGKDPGAREIIKLFGQHQLPPLPDPTGPTRGHPYPENAKVLKKKIS